MAQDNVQAIPPRTSIQPFEAVLEGKCSDINSPKDSEFAYYTFNGKAKDQYSTPPLFQVSQNQNQRPFCRVGDEVRIKVLVAGYGRRNNGNLYVTNTLNFIEMV